VKGKRYAASRKKIATSRRKGMFPGKKARGYEGGLQFRKKKSAGGTSSPPSEQQQQLVGVIGERERSMKTMQEQVSWKCEGERVGIDCLHYGGRDIIAN